MNVSGRELSLGRKRWLYGHSGMLWGMLRGKTHVCKGRCARGSVIMVRLGFCGTVCPLPVQLLSFSVQYGHGNNRVCTVVAVHKCIALGACALSESQACFRFCVGPKRRQRRYPITAGGFSHSPQLSLNYIMRIFRTRFPRGLKLNQGRVND